jgi:ketosteroid isomerase-like protein
MKAYSLFLFLASFYLTACNQPSTSVSTEKKDTVTAFDVSAVKSTIDENNKIFGDAVVKGDSATLVNLYATTAHLYPANMPPIEAYDGIKRFFGEFVKSGVKEFKLQTVDVYGNGDNIIEEGKYTIGDGKGKTIDQGKYIVIWREENGKWKLYRDFFNSDLPLTKSSK